MSAARAAARREQKAKRRERDPMGRAKSGKWLDGFANDVHNADRARKRRAMRRFGISGKRYRELEHKAKRLRRGGAR